MDDGGTSTGIYEIFEIAMAVTILLLIGTAIVVVPQIESIKNKAIATESTYIANLVGDTDITVKTKHPETKIELIGNSIKVENTKKKISISKEIYGENHKIEKISNEEYCFSSGQSCSSSTKSITGNGGQFGGAGSTGNY